MMKCVFGDFSLPTIIHLNLSHLNYRVAKG